MRLFKCSYISDVCIESDKVTLVDSKRVIYIIYKSETEAIKQFKTWFNTVFSKGVTQFLTVFECERAEVDDEVQFIVKKILNADRLDNKNSNLILENNIAV